MSYRAIIYLPQIAIGEPGDQAKKYPLLSGKDDFRQSLVDSFPTEVEAIDKFLAALKVSMIAMQILVSR